MNLALPAFGQNTAVGRNLHVSGRSFCASSPPMGYKNLMCEVQRLRRRSRSLVFLPPPVSDRPSTTWSTTPEKPRSYSDMGLGRELLTPELLALNLAFAQVTGWSPARPCHRTRRASSAASRQCQCDKCDKCAADRASQHPTGEINEWGDNLVQRDRYDLTEGEEEE